MAIGNEEMKIESVDSLLNSLSSNLDMDSLSPDDVAWADSCLNKDVDDSNIDWNSINDALLEILSSQPETSEILTSVEIGGGSDKNEDFIINDDFGEGDRIDKYDNDDNYDDDDDDDDDDDLVFRKKRSGVRGKILVDDVFCPNYSEPKVENPNSDLTSSLTTNDVGPSSNEDIFRVWDLGISNDEEDDFTKELNKALDVGSSKIQSLTDDDDDSMKLKEIIDVTIDDIIAGVGDLSLKQYS